MWTSFYPGHYILETVGIKEWVVLVWLLVVANGFVRLKQHICLNSFKLKRQLSQLKMLISTEKEEDKVYSCKKYNPDWGVFFTCALFYVPGCLPWEEVDTPCSIAGKSTGHWERLPGMLAERMCPFYNHSTSPRSSQAITAHLLWKYCMI